MSQDDKQLAMTFDPKVIEHLGVRMYSTLPPVLSELIANAYDADAEKVEVQLYDENEKKIIVKDDGVGMSLNEIQNKFLVIGRNRREEEEGKTTQKGRKPIGKKGLGKLSFFGIVRTITVDTVKNGKKNVFEIDWGKLMDTDGRYSVDHKIKNQSVEQKNGTIITLTNIKRKSTFSGKDTANSISRFFIFDKSFSVTVKRNKNEIIKVTNKMRFSLLKPEFTWNIPDDLKDLEFIAYIRKLNIRGRIITSEEPIRPSINARGVTLFSRQKLVQVPYQFAESTSSHFFSYLSGWLEVNFIDDVEEDVISTNRQGLNWEHPDMVELHSNLQKCISHIQKEWRKKRKDKKMDNLTQEASNAWLDSMPRKMRKEMNILLKILQRLSSVREKETKRIIGNLLKIIPSYPYYHWRHLHRSLQDPLINLYKNDQYLAAAREGEKIYQDEVGKKAQIDETGTTLFNAAFSSDNHVLEIQSPFIQKQTKESVQKGQRTLSVGLLESFRNPVAHNVDSRNLRFFSEDDCLDVLSLISFLLRRVDKSKKLNRKKKGVKKNG